MKTIIPRFFLFFVLPGLFSGMLHAQTQTPFEKGGGNISATYDETIAFYKQLEASSKLVKIFEYKDGTDCGKPLHLVAITTGGVFHPNPLKKADKRVILINNGIHAGEPCGVDASMVLARDLVEDRVYGPLLDHVVVLIIPFYNVGGGLNRGCCSRANQNGPEMHGFRGNGRLLDLNRDFVKMDSRNARTFSKIFQHWKPDFFIDTHTTNGADYPYRLTYLSSQRNKFNPELGQYQYETLIPSLSDQMVKADYEMCPYVQLVNWNATPDSGIVGFMDSPRYSSGYASMFNAISFITEAHMLKSFEDRVYGTYHFILNTLKFINRDRKILGRMRKEADKALINQSEFVLQWKLDRKQVSQLKFKGYAGMFKPSAVTGKQRLYYDRSKPWEKEIPYYNTYVPEVKVQKPKAYLIPQSWRGVIERLQAAGVKLRRTSGAGQIDGEVYFIEDYETGKQPYEGHYPHSQVKVRKEKQTVSYLAGDYVVTTDQFTNRFIVETLEPQGVDSWFSWNFFDEILQRKEYFSAYVFEDEAARLIQEHPDWKTELDEAMKQDSVLAGSTWMQLDFIYRKSEHYEATHMRYPVARLQKLPALAK